ncbi:hypothetical protein PENANT_c015G07256 [Penicillium antarcticum]|uniref:Uncharacterized protein n=1 Tax=Penicillium antarcticum TaxID=416450 RepID=A0A1V6Q3N6_9EURO|nr:uncharacterized protein N7508_004788 [Penicillium antarcticum]KAJ5305773.1 hypothetical protein N7508_004788 [Penicillium antarcticum]OQD83855.1 hypothetical protein PENANT_c015G07256 [Penicillium antarcticum]
MPVIPESSDFPSVLKKGENESQNKPNEESQKASAKDFLSKGPHIPDNMPPKASKEELEARMKELNK